MKKALDGINNRLDCAEGIDNTALATIWNETKRGFIFF